MGFSRRAYLILITVIFTPCTYFTRVQEALTAFVFRLLIDHVSGIRGTLLACAAYGFVHT
jgi:hypothetical protein